MSVKDGSKYEHVNFFMVQCGESIDIVKVIFLKKDVNRWCRVIITTTGKWRTDYKPFSFSEERKYHTNTHKHTQNVFSAYQKIENKGNVSNKKYKIRDQNRIKHIMG